MKKVLQDYSFGIIPLRKIDGQWHTFIVLQTNGYWSFPKGHAQGNETPQEAAERELYEETGLNVVSYYAIEPFVVMYKSHVTRIYQKEVTFFCASVSGNIQLCPIEVMKGEWVLVSHISKFIVFDVMQPLLKELESRVKEL